MPQGFRPMVQFKPLVMRSFTAASTLDIILGGIFMKTSNYTPSPEDLTCHDDIFEHLHATHNSTITTTNVKGNLTWVPFLDIVKPHHTEEEEMLLGKNVPHMKIIFTHNCGLTLSSR